MTHPLGWAFAVLTVVLGVVALVMYSRVRGRLTRVDFRGRPSAEVRSLVRSVRAGRLPDDEILAPVALEYARQVVNNFPLRMSYAPFSLAAGFTAGIAAADFLGLSTVAFGVAMAILIALNIRNAQGARAGAQALLDALGE